jgi:hypothetical protein
MNSQTDKLVKIASGFKLFHDNTQEAFAFVNKEVIPIRSRQFKYLLAKVFYEVESRAPNSEALNQAITVLEGKAVYENVEITLFNRIAKRDGTFWYDIGKGKAIKITSKGWDIVDAPILFKRYSHQQPQIIPIKKGDPWQIFKFLYVGENYELLILVYIVSCFIPGIPHPVLCIYGPQGAGKTTVCKGIKRLCDPSVIETFITPKNIVELVQVLMHHYICLFDNMSSLPPWMSDTLAQACTGGGFSKRQLYTDDDDIIYQFKRCIGLNGLNLLINKPDLMDRSILLPLERIKPSKRVKETRLWEEFEKAKPTILGGILNTLTKAMAIQPKVEVNQLPRMADFLTWGVAITQALGYKPEDFINTYQANIEAQNTEVINYNTLAQAILIFMENQGHWQGTVGKLYEELKRQICGIYPVTSLSVPPTRLDETFPKHPNQLRKALEQLRPTLREYGIDFTIGHFHTRVGMPIEIRRIKTFITINEEIAVETW